MYWYVIYILLWNRNNVPWYSGYEDDTEVSQILLPLPNGKPFFVSRKVLHFFFFFVAVLGLHCRTQAFSSCREWGPHFVAVLVLLIAVASLVAEHGLQARGLH